MRRDAHLWIAGAAAVVALCVILYLSTPLVSGIAGPVVEPFIDGVRNMLGKLTGGEARSKVVAQAIVAAGGRALLGPFLAITYAESRHNPLALNARTNASGVCQIMPSNWSAWGLSGDTASKSGSVFSPYENVAGCLNGQTLLHWNRILDRLPGVTLEDATALLYIGHAEGGAVLNAALAYCQATGAVTFEAGLEGVREKFGNVGGRGADGFYNNPATMRRVSYQAVAWEERAAAWVDEGTA